VLLGLEAGSGHYRFRVLIMTTVLAVALFVLQAVQAATLQTSLTPSRARVGDLLQLKVTVEGSGNATVEWPLFDPDSLAFQLVSVDSAGMLARERIFNLALYDTGQFLLPPLPIVLHTVHSKETLYTHALAVQIVSTLPDTANAPQPIRGPRTLPLTLRDILSLAIWPLVILAVVAAAFLYWRSRKKRQPEKIALPEIILPAHELALQELIQLRDKKLPQKGMLKEFFSELSEVLRRYIERRYRFPALEMTTWDIEQELRRDDFPQILHGEGLLILRESDLVKFAKYLPPWQSCDEHLECAFRIVEATKEIMETKEMGAAA